MLDRATRFAATTWSIPVADLELSLEEIVGGLESRVVRAIFRSRLLKHPPLAPVGVLLAVLGYALGTYAGWLSGQLMASRSAGVKRI